MMKRFSVRPFAASLLILTALMASLLSGCGGDEAAEGAQPHAGYFSDFELETFDREDTVTEEIFADYELSMINIWGTFCAPCIAEMPYLQEISEESADKGLQVIGLCSDVFSEGAINDDLMADGQAIIDATGVTYLQLIPDQTAVDELLSEIYAVPTTYFVDSEGNTVKVVIGGKDKEGWESVIDELLADEQEETE